MRQESVGGADALCRKYLKCDISSTALSGRKILNASVISPAAVQYKGNPNTEWFHDAGFGIMTII